MVIATLYRALVETLKRDRRDVACNVSTSPTRPVKDAACSVSTDPAKPGTDVACNVSTKASRISPKAETLGTIVRSYEGYDEDGLIEQPTITIFSRLSWKTANCFHEIFGSHGTLGRETSSEVVLLSRLREALQTLNPGTLIEAINLAVEELTRDRSHMSPAQANRAVYLLLKNGMKVPVRDEDGLETTR